MFDVGFTELVLIGLVALLVLGPTKMMEVARFSGRWAGRLRRQFQDVKDDIDRELQLEDMRRRLADEERALRDNLDVKLPEVDLMNDAPAVVASSTPDESASVGSNTAPIADDDTSKSKAP